MTASVPLSYVLQYTNLDSKKKKAQFQHEEDIMVKVRKENTSHPSLSLKQSQCSLSLLTPPGKSLKRPGERKNNNLPTRSPQCRRLSGDYKKKGSRRQGKKFPLLKETQACQTTPL